jgi:hypothetical protein
MIARVLQWLRRMASPYPASEKAAALRVLLADLPPADPSAPRVAVQCIEDPFYLAMFGAVCARLRARGFGGADLALVRTSISGVIGASALYRVLNAAFTGRRLEKQWQRAFESLGTSVAFRLSSPSGILSEIGDFLRAFSAWRRMRAAEDPSQLQVLGVTVGDLVIDTYIRYRPRPRFEPGDPFVFAILRQAHRSVRQARRYFGSRRTALYLTSYATYIFHGIPVRVALQEGVRVHSFGNFVDIGKRLVPADWFHTPDASEYRTQFARLDGQAERLQRAQRELETRMSGGIDPATSYMKTSAYAHGDVELPDVRGATVVFLHDFYDSPHVYDRMIFTDFWAWIRCTIEALRRNGRPFFIKPHPNQISLSGDALAQLEREFPGLPMLPVRASNVVLAQRGMLCGVTVYGTVAHELAYLGVPTIACARHPHHAFQFCRTARSVEEYRAFLAAPETLPLPREEMRRQALEFVYMNNLHGSLATRELRERFLDLWKTSHGDHRTAAEASASFVAIRDSEGLDAFAAQCAEVLTNDPTTVLSRDSHEDIAEPARR